MSQVIFCATDYYLKGGYGSYVDFFNLAGLSGYKVIPLSELDPQSDNTYIVTPLNGEWMQGWDKPKARIIHYELEWRVDWRADVNTPPGVAETWAADPAYAARIGARYVPMGSHIGLNECPDLHPTKMYDVAQLSYQTHRRQIITRQLIDEGRLTIIDGSALDRFCEMLLDENGTLVEFANIEKVDASAVKQARRMIEVLRKELGIWS